MIAVLKLPKMVTKLKRPASLMSDNATGPLALCDQQRPSSSDAPSRASSTDSLPRALHGVACTPGPPGSEVKASCLVKVDALQSSFDELKTLCIEVEAQACSL